MKGNKTAIVLTELVDLRSAGPHRQFAPKSIVIPVTRVAKVEAMPLPEGTVNPPGAFVTLRTPEEYIWTVETPDRVAALMNGEG